MSNTALPRQWRQKMSEYEATLRQFARTVRTGAWVVLRAIWALLLRFEPQFPVALFYILGAPILVHLHHSSNAPTTVDFIDIYTPFAWWHVVFVFVICGLVTAQKRHPYIYAVATIPMFLYAGALLDGVGRGYLANNALSTGLFVMVASLASLISIRISWELRLATRRLAALEEKERARGTASTGTTGLVSGNP